MIKTFNDSTVAAEHAALQNGGGGSAAGAPSVGIASLRQAEETKLNS